VQTADDPDADALGDELVRVLADSAIDEAEQSGDLGVYLIALTGWGQDEDRRRTEEAGFDHHLVKPVELDALARLLGSLPRITSSSTRS